MSAFAGADTRGELSTDECRRVMDEIARVNPNVFLILTGGEPLLRKDIWDIAAYAAEKRFTTVLGTNGVLLRGRDARARRQGAELLLPGSDRARQGPHRHRSRGLRAHLDLPREGAGGRRGAAVLREDAPRAGRAASSERRGGVRGSVVDTGGQERRAPHPGEVCPTLPARPLRDEPVLAAAPQLRPRLVSGRQVLLSHHAGRRRH